MNIYVGRDPFFCFSSFSSTSRRRCSAIISRRSKRVSRIRHFFLRYYIGCRCSDACPLADLLEDPRIADGAAADHDAVDTGDLDHALRIFGRIDTAVSNDREC